MAEIKSPAKAIRAYCLECTGNQPSEVRNCTIKRCPLYPFRFGKNPFHSRSNKRLAENEEMSESALIGTETTLT
jgi:hypothetical protein